MKTGRHRGGTAVGAPATWLGMAPTMPGSITKKLVQKNGTRHNILEFVLRGVLSEENLHG